MRAARQASLLPDRLGDKRALIEAFDPWAKARNAVRNMAAKAQEWAGIPMPIDGQQLVVEPKFAAAAVLTSMYAKEDEPLPSSVTQRNCWWSDRLRAEIYIWNEGGKVLWAKLPRPHHFNMDINALGCSDVWGIEQESNAVHLLGSLVSHRQFKHYMLTGMFLETSKRSGLTYLFRRLRPTIAMDARDHTGGSARILAALCMHPIAYYAETWAGAMCPTDDVVAHLMMMRGDEHLFWKRCNQHSPSRPEAGL